MLLTRKTRWLMSWRRSNRLLWSQQCYRRSHTYRRLHVNRAQRFRLIRSLTRSRKITQQRYVHLDTRHFMHLYHYCSSDVVVLSVCEEICVSVCVAGLVFMLWSVWLPVTAVIRLGYRLQAVWRWVNTWHLIAKCSDVIWGRQSWQQLSLKSHWCVLLRSEYFQCCLRSRTTCAPADVWFICNCWLSC